MQPARIELHAQEHTNNLVQKPMIDLLRRGWMDICSVPWLVCCRPHSQLLALVGQLRREKTKKNLVPCRLKPLQSAKPCSGVRTKRLNSEERGKQIQGLQEGGQGDRAQPVS